MAASYATRLLGGENGRFPLIVSASMAGMGFGIWLSHKISHHWRGFILVNILISLSCSALIPLSYSIFSITAYVQSLFLLFSAVVGASFGLELALFQRLIPVPKGYFPLLQSITLGGFMGVPITLWLLPLGWFRAGPILGLFHGCVGLLFVFSNRISDSERVFLILSCVLCVLFSILFFILAEPVRAILEQMLSIHNI